jgi:DNA repair protein RadA
MIQKKGVDYMTKEENLNSEETQQMEEIGDAELKEKAINEFLAIKGVGKTAAEKIWDAQYFSLMDVAAASLGDFMERTGMTKSSAEKVISGARALVDIGKSRLASDMLKEEDPSRLSTGSKMVDELLGGGYPLKLITEIFGENGTGKSQCCLTASVLATQPKKDGGLDGHVVYIDTEGTFKAHRVKEIAETRGLNWEDVLSKIHVLRPMTTSHQLLMMDEVRKIGAEVPVKLVVCDSLMGHFRAEFVGRGVLAERQQLISKHLAEIKSFITTNDAVGIITSQVSANPGLLFGDPNQAIGGNVVGHAVAYRVKIRKGKNGTRVFRLIKAPDLPESEAVALLTEKGIQDK